MTWVFLEKLLFKSILLTLFLFLANSTQLNHSTAHQQLKRPKFLDDDQPTLDFENTEAFDDLDPNLLGGADVVDDILNEASSTSHSKTTESIPNCQNPNQSHPNSHHQMPNSNLIEEQQNLNHSTSADLTHVTAANHSGNLNGQSSFNNSNGIIIGGVHNPGGQNSSYPVGKPPLPNQNYQNLNQYQQPHQSHQNQPQNQQHNYSGQNLDYANPQSNAVDSGIGSVPGVNPLTPKEQTLNNSGPTNGIPLANSNPNPNSASNPNPGPNQGPNHSHYPPQNSNPQQNLAPEPQLVNQPQHPTPKMYDNINSPANSYTYPPNSSSYPNQVQPSPVNNRFNHPSGQNMQNMTTKYWFGEIIGFAENSRIFFVIFLMQA